MKVYKLKHQPTVDVVRWTGDNLDKVIRFTGMHPSVINWSWSRYSDMVDEYGLKVFHARGGMHSTHAAIGDYIVRGIDGDLHVFDPVSFRMMFTCVEEEAEVRREPDITVVGRIEDRISEIDHDGDLAQELADAGIDVVYGKLQVKK